MVRVQKNKLARHNRYYYIMWKRASAIPFYPDKTENPQKSKNGEMSNTIYSSDSDEYEYDDETYNTNTSSTDDSFKSTSYEEEENTDSSSNENNTTNNLEDDILDSVLNEEDETGLSEEENKADSAEERRITEEDNSVRKEGNTEEREDEMTRTAGICAMISNNIHNLSDQDIGSFALGNTDYTHDIINKMRTIRETNKPNDFHQIYKEIHELMGDPSFLSAYGKLRKIYEFILHMLDIYDVPIDETVPAIDDKKLRSTMKEAAGKEMKHHEKPKYAVLTPVQCITVL